MIKVVNQRKSVNKFLEWENRHWWYLGRRKILTSIVEGERLRMAETSSKPKLLDIGCGAGKIAYELSDNFDVVGVDNIKISIDTSKSINKGNNAKFFLRKAEKLNFRGQKFDVIIAFDVLEHIEDDTKALERWRGLLKKGGTLLVSVPAFSWLWGVDDVLADHYRRYSKKELASKLKVNYKLIRITYFNFFLFPITAMVRLIKRLFLQQETMSEDELFKNADFRLENKLINPLLLKIFSFEEKILRKFSLPFGVSLLAVCQKK
jgi:2-polyprenyl-3-methyl-5-hydroxy-6-metoxy-1,4-benzoquinol methylase